MEKNNLFLSICIPTYNRSHFLSETIRSVLKQTHKNFELIILNDGSTDGTEDVVKSFTDKRIKYVKNEKNIGYIKTMNKGTKLAKADWIMHVSDDDRMRPTMLEEMVNALSLYEYKTIGFVVPQSANINENGKLISEPARQLEKNDHILLEPKEFIYNFTLYGKKIRGKYKFNTSFPSTLFNKKILIELGMSSEEVPVSHDILIESKICLLYPVIVIDKPLFEYRVHQNWGSSLNRSGGFLREYIRFLSILFQFVKEKKIQFNYNFENYCIQSLLTYLFSFNGGLVRLAARFNGGYIKRLHILSTYITFGLKKDKTLLISPQFYGSIGISFLPQRILLLLGRILGQI